jgi:folate/biopterin transporter
MTSTVENEATTPALKAAHDIDLETAPLLAQKNRKRFAVAGFELSAWSQNLVDHFGYKFLVMLFASQHLLKGFLGSFLGSASQFLFSSYGVAGPRMQIFGGVVGLPWAMKPVIGLISDAMPIKGYRKSPYMILTAIVGVVACSVVGVIPQAHIGVEFVVMCLFLMQLQFSTCDLLTEATYAEKMQSSPEYGPDLMTFVWFGLQLAGLFATVLIGPIIHHYGPKLPYIIAVVPMAFVLIPIAKNYMEEVQQKTEDTRIARQNLMEQKEACGLCVLMFIGTLSLTYLGIAYESVELNAAAALAFAIIMLVAFSLVLRPIVAKVNAFFLLQTSLGFSIGGASFYFYTDTPEQYPEGPHFSIEFFSSVLGVVGSICSLIGIYSYQRWMRDWTYQRLLMMTNIVLSILSFTDVVMFTRLNIRLGLPDHAFVLGSSVLTTVIAQWMWMPGVVILSQLCPKGMEATMYALLAGCHNLGNTIASNCGALVLEWVKCSPSGQPHESKQFENLWVASALSTILPMFTLILLPWLIPDAKQTDKLLDDDDRDATTGSLWKRLTGKSQ